MTPIAHIESPYGEKFGVPRQSGMVDVVSTVVFEPPFRVAEALRGLDGFSHLWLIWLFHKAQREDWSPTVRPPRLGGNTRVGVFATRSPFRPNAIGLSAVKLLGVEDDPTRGPIIKVSGADVMDGTPILDIKPYLPYADSIAEATGGFATQADDRSLRVVFAPETMRCLESEMVEQLRQVIAHDPRPRYHDDPHRL